MWAGLVPRGEGLSQMTNERAGIPGRSAWSLRIMQDVVRWEAAQCLAEQRLKGRSGGKAENGQGSGTGGPRMFSPSCRGWYSRALSPLLVKRSLRSAAPFGVWLGREGEGK